MTPVIEQADPPSLRRLAALDGTWVSAKSTGRAPGGVRSMGYQPALDGLRAISVIAVVFLCIGVVLVGVQGGLVRPLARRMGARGAITVGLACNAAGLLVLAAAVDWGVLIPALVLLTVGQGLTAPNFTAMISNGVHPDQRGEALGFQQSASALGRVGGPALAGFLFHHVGVPAPYLVAAALCGVGLAILQWSPVA